MEHASLAVADVVTALASRGEVVIACGLGNNGGDGWALARHLAHRSRLTPVVHPLGPARPGSDAEINETIARRMGIATIAEREAVDWRGAAVVVDALFGTGLTRAIEGEAAAVIEAINASPAPVVAVDVPSGLDGDTGRALGPVVRATRTVTFVAKKPGLLEPDAASIVGDVSVADIGAPWEIVMRLAGSDRDRRE